MGHSIVTLLNECLFYAYLILTGVSEPPNITYVSPAQIALKENETLHFECSAVGTPTPDLK